MALEMPKTALAAVIIICIASVIIRPSLADQVLFTSTQEMDVTCVCSSNATMLPQHYTMDATNSSLVLGPLFPGQNLTCSTGGGMSSSCTVTFSQLALASSVACGPYISLSCPSCNSTADLLQSIPDVAQTPKQPYCNGTLHLEIPAGSFTDGSPAGADYAPSSFCQWLIDPGYRPVRLNFTRFATEQNFDWVYILQLDRNGSQNVLQKVSGSSSQVPSSITVPSSRAVVAFLSDGANQDNGFEVSWDQGIFCSPMTAMNTSKGSFSDGAPLGQRYRPYTHCEWLIELGYGPIQLSFQRFSLAAGDTLDVYRGRSADLSRLVASYRGAEVPEPLVTAEEDSSDLVFLNNTLTEAMLVVFNVADGSVLGSGFSATYSRVHQGQVSSNRSFSKGAAAGIIIAAVGFGLLTGVGMGCAILRCYIIYLHCRQGEP
ncbi:hypothetical protein CVIRNUC_007286 [Coccomyxa viridis]|uniref:CUB domain-containing protein n=1 Tax=Coccomyxa viridis TaxID=1274662 RepID=A0AAV1I9M7_9CHLO|nr:hypothetical protein CVIRNUC_007286 [Coccomyxa viridis]